MDNASYECKRNNERREIFQKRYDQYMRENSPRALRIKKEEKEKKEKRKEFIEFIISGILFLIFLLALSFIP